MAINRRVDESLEEAAIREAKEELGVAIEIERYLGSFPETYEFGDATVPFLATYFVAKIVDGEPGPNDDVAEIGYFSKEEIARLDIAYPALKHLLVSGFRDCLA